MELRVGRALRARPQVVQSKPAARGATAHLELRHTAGPQPSFAVPSFLQRRPKVACPAR